MLGIRYPSRTITVFNIDEYFMAHELTTVAKWAVNSRRYKPPKVIWMQIDEEQDEISAL
jgi:hypothetical protein